MRRRAFLWGLGFVVVITGVVAVWGAIRARQGKTVVLPDGTRVTYMGATYGRVHTMPEWRLQWGWPPIQRVEHRLETKTDALRLWFRSEGTALTGPNAVRTVDNRLCESRPYILRIERLGARTVRAILAEEPEGLPADGRAVSIEFYPSLFFSPNLQPDKPVARIEASLPKAPITEQIKQPETLPATRRSGMLTVNLKGFRWVYHERQSVAPPMNAETILADPEWELKPSSGSLRDWKLARIQFAPVGAGRLTRPVNSILDSAALDAATEVKGNWDAPVYAFFVEFAHKPTGQREKFEFYVPPPPVERLRERGRLERQAQQAIAAGRYADAVRVWENAPAEFARQAHYWRGYAYAMQGDYQRAVREFEQAQVFIRSDLLSAYDQEYDARLGLVFCLLLQGRRAEAVALARSYVQRVYDVPEYQWRADERAALLCMLLPALTPSPVLIEQRTRAWKQEARRRNNYYIIDGLHRIRAMQAVQRRDYRTALREFQAGRKYHGFSASDALWLAWLHHRAGQPAAARKFLQEARRQIKRFPDQGHPEQLECILLERLLFGQRSAQ